MNIECDSQMKRNNIEKINNNRILKKIHKTCRKTEKL